MWSYNDNSVQYLFGWMNFSISAEAIHVALLIYKHGYFYSVDKDELQIKEDNTLFRFQVCIII